MITFKVHLISESDDEVIDFTDKQKQEVVMAMMDAITAIHPELVLMVGEEVDIPLTKDLLLDYGFEKTRYGYDYNKGELTLEVGPDGKIIDILDNGGWITLKTQKDLFDYYRIIQGSEFKILGRLITRELLLELGFKEIKSMFKHPNFDNIVLYQDLLKIWRLQHSDTSEIIPISTIGRLKYELKKFNICM